LSFLDETIKSILDKSKVLSFKFNYRADYSQDEAYLIAKDDHFFVITGFKIPYEFVGLEEQLIEVPVEEDTDELDFGMI